MELQSLSGMDQFLNILRVTEHVFKNVTSFKHICLEGLNSGCDIVISPQRRNPKKLVTNTAFNNVSTKGDIYPFLSSKHICDRILAVITDGVSRSGTSSLTVFHSI